MRTIKCAECRFITYNKRFCSRECYYLNASKNPNSGAIKTGQVRLELRGKNNPNWKGNKAGYTSIHQWLYIRLGKPQKCDHCGTTIAKKYEWANISKTYQRNIKDWLRLCTSCHRKYDGHSNKAWQTRRAYASNSLQSLG
jgi:hypothetical protein